MKSAPFLLLLLLPLQVLVANTSSAHELTDNATNDGHNRPAAQQLMTTRQSAKVLPPTKEQGVFHFVIYGDRTGGVPEGIKVLQQAVVDTNLLDPDLVMTVGDLIQGYSEKPQWMKEMVEYHSVMDSLNMRWFPVAGNHDIYWRGDGQAPDGHHEANYEEHFGPLWYSFKHKNAGFIILYSDEGDPVSNRKGFTEGSLQQMSEEQLEFLDKALADLKDQDHVMVFLHHPRWIGRGYTGTNWDVVHEKLHNAGNVSAVFAGHIHQMRFDEQDGIEYHTLATTGGHLGADIPDAGHLHHLNFVTVRKERISVSALPVGAVMDPKEFTPSFLAQVEKARSIRPIQTSEDLILSVDGTTQGELRYTVSNPCKHDVAYTASFDRQGADDTWRTTLDHQHFTIAAGESAAIEFSVRRPAEQFNSVSLPVVRLKLEYLGETTRVKLPSVAAKIGLQPGSVPTGYFANSKPHCLRVQNASAAVIVDAESVPLPDGPMTLETWVRPAESIGYNAIVAKTENSEYSLFSDEGVPQFSIHLDGKYVTASAEKKLKVDRWTHLAGVFSGDRVMLYVNGKLVGEKLGSGKRATNKLPLIIGADPDGGGRPTRAFNGQIDEVRLSKQAVYTTEFKPVRQLSPSKQTLLLHHFDKKLGPFVLDHSNSAATGYLGRESELVPVSN